MSYSYYFTQFPSKEYSELWDAFLHGTFSASVQKKVAAFEAERAEVEEWEVDTLATFWSNREAFLRKEKKRTTLDGLTASVDRWKKLGDQLAEHETGFREATSTRVAEQHAKAAMKLFTESERMLVPDVSSWGESARDPDYRFLVLLYKKVTKKDLDILRTMPTTDDWYNFYQHLKPEFVNAQWEELFREEYIEEHEREFVKKLSLELLHRVKYLLKTCRERGWDLLFLSEYGRTTLPDTWIKRWWKQRVDSAVATRFPE